MPVQLVLRSKQLQDLAVIRDLGNSKIQAVIDKLSSIEPAPMRPYDLHRAILDILSTRDADILMRQLIPLYTIRRQRDLSAKDLIESLSSGISKAAPPWNEEQISRWKALEETLHKLFSLSIVWTVIKAMDLSFDYPQLLQNIKIMTDIRPIFNEEASEIQGSIITYTLRIYFDSIGGSESLSIAMDENDVKKLKKICERALNKAQTAKSFMQKADIKRTVISGEEI